MIRALFALKDRAEPVVVWAVVVRLLFGGFGKTPLWLSVRAIFIFVPAESLSVTVMRPL